MIKNSYFLESVFSYYSDFAILFHIKNFKNNNNSNSNKNNKQIQEVFHIKIFFLNDGNTDIFKAACIDKLPGKFIKDDT